MTSLSTQFNNDDDDEDNFFIADFDNLIRPTSTSNTDPESQTDNSSIPSRSFFNQLLSQEQQSKLYRLTQIALNFFHLHLGQPIWATGGTALGALRHQSIIPWDDDVDLCTVRSAATTFLIKQVRDSKDFLSKLQQEHENDHEEKNSKNEGENVATVNDSMNSVVHSKITSLLAELQTKHQVRIACKRNVGLRFYDMTMMKKKNLSTNNETTTTTTTEEEASISSLENLYPFVDIFVMQKVQNVKVLCQKYPAVARKLRDTSPSDFDESDGENEQEGNDDNDKRNQRERKQNQELYIIEDAVGRSLWPAELWFSESIPGLSKSRHHQQQQVRLHPFGPLMIPLSLETEDYLDRTYGNDWKTVAKSHTIDHETNEIRHEVSSMNLEDAMKKVVENEVG